MVAQYHDVQANVPVGRRSRNSGASRAISHTMAAIAMLASSPALSGEATADPTTIMPGDARFNTPEFEDYQAMYSSSSSTTGGFTFQARKSGDGKKLAMIDIIPLANYVIVAQRQIDLATHRLEFGAGPYLAWGQEFVVSVSDGTSYSWSRSPIGAGDHKQSAGPIANGGYVSEMFSPTLASLMPMEIGSRFRLPEAYPRADETVTSEFDDYHVLRKERLELPSGFGCECWLIEKKTWNGMTDHIWVSREAPFVFRRIRDIGGKREFTSDLLAYSRLEQ